MENKLKNIVKQQKAGKPVGIYSACSGNPYVIKAVLRKGKQDGSCCLIEATANQCDQYGGYTGKTPKQFKEMVYQFANEIGFDTNKLFLGGDHLGPLTFANLPEKEAMEKASELIDAYVSSGFTKIHIDTSMKVKDDDPNTRLSDEIIATRAAKLAQVAKESYKKLLEKDPGAVMPVFVVGSEVPIPGGATKATNTLEVTKVEDFESTIACFKKKFEEYNVSDIFDEVIGIVVQPGIEENDNGCVDYIRENAVELSKAINKYPNLVFEAHSSDYQTKEHLRELVLDGFAILKVGPALTYALREGLFALSYIEDEIADKPSNFRKLLLEKMEQNPKYWQKHYYGTEKEVNFKKKYSFSDRCRYYLTDKDVEECISVMFNNLKEIPNSILSQFMPNQYNKVRRGELNKQPLDLLLDKVGECIDDYLYATKQNELF